jgi:DNA invertase Pin-like site-specific DNA recombinase
MKYIIYLRVSTDQQVQSGLGLEAQRNMCVEYISKNGNHPYIEFMDEGYSGALSMDKRPGLLLALKELECDDIFLVAKRDRLGRDVIVNAMIESAIQRKKARIVSASGDFSGDSDPSSILMKRLIDSFAEYERLIIGARTKVALNVKKKRSERIGRIPFGYKLNEDKLHLEVCEREKAVLSEMIAMKNSGMSLRKIAEELNSKGFLSRDNTFWSYAAVNRVLINNIQL